MLINMTSRYSVVDESTVKASKLARVLEKIFRDKAIKQLRAKLYELALQEKKAGQQALEDSKADIGWGSQIRSYVLDQSRVKDLRTNIERSDPGNVLDGDIDDLIEASLKAGL